MLKDRIKTNHFEKIYSLEPVSVDEASEQVLIFLTSIKIKKETIIRVRLSVEEALLRWVDHYGEGEEFRLEMGIHWSRPYIMLKLWADECDPLSERDDELGMWAGDLLETIGLTPVFRYINGCNVLQIPLKMQHRNPGVTLLLCTIVGTLIGVAIDLTFSADLKMMITTTVLTPLQNAFFRVLNAVSAPVMFLSVLTTTYSVGSISISRKGGLRMMRKFLIYCTLTTIAALLISFPLFDIPTGVAMLSQREVSGVLDFFLDILPGDMLSPFINGDFTQLIMVALLIGNAFVIAGAKVQTLVTIVEEANTAGLYIAEWIGDLSPGIVAFLIVLGIQDSTIHQLFGIWKPAVLITVLAALALLLKMVRVSLDYKVPLNVLWSKMKESYLLSLSTFSVDTSYPSNVKCCEEKLGINVQLTAFGLPLGLICFMPVSSIASTVLTLYAAECYKVPVSSVWLIMALFLSVSLAAAGPPTAGIGILTYTVMFSKLLIPKQALTIVLVGDILMGFVIYPVNQAMLQLELIREADKLDLLDRDMLQKAM